MTAEVKERHRRAAAVGAGWDPTAPGYVANWIATGDTGVFPCFDDDVAQLVDTAQAIAQAEERGRMEERVRCSIAAWRAGIDTSGMVAIVAGQPDAWEGGAITRLIVELADRETEEDGEATDDDIRALVDAARKELEE